MGPIPLSLPLALSDRLPASITHPLVWNCAYDSHCDLFVTHTQQMIEMDPAAQICGLEIDAQFDSRNGQVLWDNRATMHLAPVGVPLAPAHRSMFRVTCRGQPFVGPATIGTIGESAKTTSSAMVGTCVQSPSVKMVARPSHRQPTPPSTATLAHPSWLCVQLAVAVNCVQGRFFLQA